MIVVTSPGKEGIAEYFRPRPDLEERLADDEALLEKVKSGARLADVSFVIQEEPLGLGHAVLTARDAVGDEPFAVILPDDIIAHEPGALSQMMEATPDDAAAVAVERVPWEIVHNYGVVDTESSDGNRHLIRGLVEKPPAGNRAPPTCPSWDAICCRQPFSTAWSELRPARATRSNSPTAWPC